VGNIHALYSGLGSNLSPETGYIKVFNGLSSVPSGRCWVSQIRPISQKAIINNLFFGGKNV
jgi:hypothetical protein